MSSLLFIIAGAVGGGLAGGAVALFGKRIARPDDSPRRQKLMSMLIAVPVGLIGFFLVIAMGSGIDGSGEGSRSFNSKGFRERPVNEAKIVDQMFDEIRFLRLLQANHPEIREKLQAILREGDQRRDVELVRQRTMQLVQQYLPQYLTRTSDSAIVKFTNTLIGMFAKFETSNPETCKRFLIGGGVRGELEKKETEAAIDAMAAVIEEAINKPQAPPDAARAQILIDDILGKIYGSNDPKLLPEEMLADMPNAPADKLCYTMVRFYRMVLTLPEPDASLMLRYVMGGSN